MEINQQELKIYMDDDYREKALGFITAEEYLNKIQEDIKNGV